MFRYVDTKVQMLASSVDLLWFWWVQHFQLLSVSFSLLSLSNQYIILISVFYCPRSLYAWSFSVSASPQLLMRLFWEWDSHKNEIVSRICFQSDGGFEAPCFVPSSGLATGYAETFFFPVGGNCFGGCCCNNSSSLLSLGIADPGVNGTSSLVFD